MIKELYKTIIKGGKYFFFTSIIDRLASLFFFFVIAKSFSVENYGQMVTVFAITNIVLTIFDFGFRIYLQREAAITKNIDAIFSAISLVTIITVIIYCLIVFVYLKSFHAEISFVYILIIASISFLINFGTLLSHIYYGMNRIDVVFYSTVVTKTIFIVVIVFLYYVQSSFSIFLCVLMSVSLFQVLVLLYALKEINVKFRFKLEYVKYVVDIVKISLPLGLAVLFNLLYDKIDIVLISRIINTESVGQYNIAYSFYKLVSILFGVVFVYGFNLFSKNTNKRINFKYLFQLSIPIVIISFLYFLFLYFLSGTILNIMFGVKYLLAQNLLPILSFAVLGFGLNSLTGVFINANGKFKGVMFCTIIGLIINIVFNVIYLPKLGVIAAAYSTIITEYSILLLESIYIYYFIFKGRQFGNI